jgi:hypothetical protein
MAMKTLCLLIGAAAFLFATGSVADPDHAFNAVDFQVPADELDAAAVGEAAVHSGFLPLSESDPRIKAGRAAPDSVYEIWELPSHKVAAITLTRMARSGKFIALFVAKDPTRRNDPLTGDACKRWLKFSAAIRTEFMHRPAKFRFRNPQCDP